MRSTALLVKPCYSDASALDYVDGGDDGGTLAERGSGVQIMRARSRVGRPLARARREAVTRRARATRRRPVSFFIF